MNIDININVDLNSDEFEKLADKLINALVKSDVDLSDIKVEVDSGTDREHKDDSGLSDTKRDKDTDELSSILSDMVVEDTEDKEDTEDTIPKKMSYKEMEKLFDRYEPQFTDVKSLCSYLSAKTGYSFDYVVKLRQVYNRYKEITTENVQEYNNPSLRFTHGMSLS